MISHFRIVMCAMTVMIWWCHILVSCHCWCHVMIGVVLLCHVLKVLCQFLSY